METLFPGANAIYRPQPEYTTSKPLDGNNDRFRASATRGFVAVGYRF